MQKKNYLRKTLALVMAFLMIVTMMPVNVFAQDPSVPAGEPVAVPGGTPDRAVDGPDWEVSDEEAESDYWSLSGYNRLNEVSQWDPIKNPTIEYKGSYNLDDREVITLVYKTNSSASSVWQRLLLKFDKTLYKMIDWKNPQTRAYRGPVKATGSANPKNFKGDAYKFKLEDRSLTGSDNVVSIALNDVQYKANVIEAPMHFVLKSPTTLDIEGLPTSIKDLTKTREPVIQSRIVDINYERVFMTPTDKLNGYSSYTSSTIIPSKDYRAGLIPESQQDNRVPWAYAQNSFISYNKKEGYVDLTIRQTKGTTGELAYGKIIGLRTVIDNRFFDTLAGSRTATTGEDLNAKIADVFIIDKDEKPYDGGSYENPVDKRRINVLRSQINKRNDGLFFIQVVGTNYKPTAAETSIKMQSKRKATATETLINSAANTGDMGVGTVVRFYVNKDNFEKLINDSQDLLNLTFYTTFTRQTQTPKDTFTGTVDKERKLKKGDSLILDFGYREFTGPLGVATAAAGDRKMTMEIGERPHTITFFSHPDQNDGTSLYWRDASSFWWNIPYNMTLKAGTQIKIYMEGIKKPIKEVKFYPNLTQYKLGDKSVDKFTIARDVQQTGDMQFMRFSENMKSPHVAKTQNEASIPEIFTEDNIFYGHTKFGYTIARVSGVSKEGTDQVLDATGNQTAASTKKLLKQAYFSDPHDVVESVGGDSYISKKYSQQVIVNKKLYNGYEFSTKDVINPDDPLGVVDGAKYKNDAFNLVKDAPIAFTTEDYEINAVEKLPPIIEQVQAKVKFNLNGGYLGDNPNAEKAKYDIIKIAPLNKNYRYLVDNNNYPTTALNKDYVANAFEGDNRRMVYPLKEVKTIVNGYTRINYVSDTSKEKVMASHTDVPLSTDVYKDVFDKFEKELQQKLAAAQALPPGTSGSDTRKVRDGAVAEAQKDIESFDTYIYKFYTSKGIDITKSQLWLREFPGKESQDKLKTKNPKTEDKKVFLGWATRPLKEEEAEDFASMPELKDVNQWADVDANTKAYKFTENSPIDKERTVYAIYGELTLVLHSGKNGADGKEITVRVPITQEDINTTREKMKGIDEAEIAERIKTQIIKALPKAPYTETDKSGSDERLKDFTKKDQTFLGWNLVKDNPKFKAGNNNNRISELDLGHDVDKNPLIQSTEWIDYMIGNQDKAYLPNGFNLGIMAGDFDKDGNLITDKSSSHEAIETLEELRENVKEIHLYAMYRPYYKITANPGYFKVKAADATHADGVLELDLEDKTKEQALLIGLMTRTAVTGYDNPTVSANANYFPIIDPSVVDENIDTLGEADLIKKLKLKKWDPSKDNNKQDLTWTEPGFDVLGRRKSYVALVVTDKNKEAYKNFAKPFAPGSWADVGISTFLKLGGHSLDDNAPKNLYDDQADPYKAERDKYGKPLAKLQTFQLEALDELGQPKKDNNGNNIVDAFTSATSRASILDDKTGEVVGYNVVITNILANLPAPEFDRVVDTYKEVKLKWEDSDKYKEITRIEIYAYDNPKATKTKTYTLEKTEDGKFSGDELKAEFDNASGRLKIKAEKSTTVPFPSGALPLVPGKDLAAKYYKTEKVTGKPDKIIKQSYIGNTRIIGDKLSEPVRKMSQGVKNKPNDKAYIKFTVPEKDLDKVGPNSIYIAEKWTGSEWVKVGQTRLTSADTINKQLENNEYKIELEEYTGDQGEADYVEKSVTKADGTAVSEKFYKVKDGDIIRIVSVEANKDNDVVGNDGKVKEIGYSNPAYSAGRDLKAGTDYPEYEKNDRAINTSEKENRDYIVLDLRGPKITPKAEDSEYRRFINIQATLDQLPKNSDVRLIVTSSNNTVIADETFTAQEVKEGITASFVEQLYRQEDGIKIKLEAIDSFGNEAYKDENNKEVIVEYEKSKVLEIQIADVSPRRKSVSVRSSEDNTEVRLEVKNKSGDLVAKGTAVAGTKNTFVDVNLMTTTEPNKPYRLKKGDIIYFIGYKLGNSNQPMDNFRSNLGQIVVK